MALAAAFGWLEWAELGLDGKLDAEASALIEGVAAELARMGAQEAAERGRRLLRGRRRAASSIDRSADLTERELDVARLVAEGLSNPEIAERLFVSTRTVTTHLTHIYRRLGLSGRTALAHFLPASGNSARRPNTAGFSSSGARDTAAPMAPPSEDPILWMPAPAPAWAVGRFDKAASIDGVA